MPKRESRYPGRSSFGLAATTRPRPAYRLRLPVALAVVLTIPLAVLFYFQFRSVSDLAESSAVVLETLSKEATDRIATEIQAGFRAPRRAVAPWLQPDVTDPLNVPVIEDIFARALDAHPLLHRLYVWSDVASLHRGELLAYDRDRRQLYGGLPEAADLIQGVRRSSSEKKVLNRLTLNILGRRTYLDATIRYREPKRDQMMSFVVLAFDAEYMRRDYIPNLLSPLVGSLPRPFAEFPKLEVTLLDQDGRVIYPRSRSTPTGHVSEREVQLLFFHPDLTGNASFDAPPEVWRLQSGYGGQSIAGIVAAHERRR